jgi:hypothetical protein
MPEDRNRSNENRERSGNESSQGGPTSNTQDLKEREYRDNKGEIHHHTHTAEEMKDKDKAA